MFVGVVLLVLFIFSSFAVEFLLYFGHQFLIRYVLCKHYVPLSKLPFHFVDGCFTVQSSLV